MSDATESNTASTAPEERLIRFQEVSKHTTETDLWFIKDKKVYDITSFVDQHPGGVDTLLGVAGKDGTVDFDSVGHSESAIVDLQKYYIGQLHPDDVDQVPSSTKEAKSNSLSFAIIFLIASICAYFIFRPS